MKPRYDFSQGKRGRIAPPGPHAMATTKWNDLKHKSSPEVRENLKREAHAELERAGQEAAGSGANTGKEDEGAAPALAQMVQREHVLTLECSMNWNVRAIACWVILLLSCIAGPAFSQDKATVYVWKTWHPTTLRRITFDV